MELAEKMEMHKKGRLKIELLYSIFFEFLVSVEEVFLIIDDIKLRCGRSGSVESRN